MPIAREFNSSSPCLTLYPCTPFTELVPLGPDLQYTPWRRLFCFCWEIPNGKYVYTLSTNGGMGTLWGNILMYLSVVCCLESCFVQHTNFIESIIYLYTDSCMSTCYGMQNHRNPGLNKSTLTEK